MGSGMYKVHITGFGTYIFVLLETLKLPQHKYDSFNKIIKLNLFYENMTYWANQRAGHPHKRIFINNCPRQAYLHDNYEQMIARGYIFIQT